MFLRAMNLEIEHAILHFYTIQYNFVCGESKLTLATDYA